MALPVGDNLQPRVETELRELAGVADAPGMVLTDAGYWRNGAIDPPLAQGIPTLVAPDASSFTATSSPPRDGGEPPARTPPGQ